MASRRVKLKAWERPRKAGRSSRLEDSRDKLPSILIVCEGEKTEPNYFAGFRVPSVNLIVVPAASVHISVVRRALKEYEKDSDFEEVWCVFDRDKNIRNKKDAEQFNKALTLAKENGFNVAYSNDAFELWYLLHFIYFDSQILRSDYIKKLQSYLDGGYRKNDPDIFTKLEDNMDEAIKRAKRLMTEHDGVNPVDADPSTTVFMLVERLKGHIR